MTAPYLRITVLNAGVIASKLRLGARRATNAKGALEDVAEDMFETIFQTFQTQGRRYGGSWVAIDPKWVERKAKMGQDTRILIATGDLMRSVTEWQDPNQILKITGREIVLESTLDYSDVHQRGWYERNIPARPFINFYPQDRKRWAKIVERSIADAIRYGT